MCERRAALESLVGMYWSVVECVCFTLLSLFRFATGIVLCCSLEPGDWFVQLLVDQSLLVRIVDLCVLRGVERVEIFVTFAVFF